MRLTPLVLAGFFAVSMPGLLGAQTPSFDVASVKPCKDGADPTRLIFSRGHLELVCEPLIRVISMAYGDIVNGRWNSFPMNAIEGGPSWTQMTMPSTNTYTIDARTTASVRDDELTGPLLRGLLEDRFKLRVRRETRQMPVYTLTQEKRGPKLKRFDGSCAVWDLPNPETPSDAKPRCPIDFGGRGNRRVVNIRGISISTFALRLGRYAQVGGDLDGPITDQTGLTGFFDIHLEYTFENATVPDPLETLPTLRDALPDQLGLRLERATGPREFLVIEHIERPSEN